MYNRFRTANGIRAKGIVRLRGGFSERYGLSEINKIQQIDEFDDDTRIRLNNELFILLEHAFEHGTDLFDVGTRGLEKLGHFFSKDILNDAFCKDTRLDRGDYFSWRLVYNDNISTVILSATYNEVLDIVQFCCNWIERIIQRNRGTFYSSINDFFKKEYVGYRFLEEFIVPITDEMELKEIAEACNNKYDGARSHMKKAVQFLADREKKDYKNCIKESISAVESICQIITGNSKATLGDALKEISKARALHPALKEGFSKLYGYTSDQGGIRHAEGLFESNVSFDEAKYFLVSCSAFVNYLIAEYAKGSN